MVDSNLKKIQTRLIKFIKLPYLPSLSIVLVACAWTDVKISSERPNPMKKQTILEKIEPIIIVFCIETRLKKNRGSEVSDFSVNDLLARNSLFYSTRQQELKLNPKR